MEHLTRGEQDILQALAEALSTKEMQRRFCCAPSTVKNRLSVLYRKLDAQDRSQALVTALRAGLVAIPPDQARTLLERVLAAPTGLPEPLRADVQHYLEGPRPRA